MTEREFFKALQGSFKYSGSPWRTEAYVPAGIRCSRVGLWLWRRNVPRVWCQRIVRWLPR